MSTRGILKGGVPLLMGVRRGHSPLAAAVAIIRIGNDALIAMHMNAKNRFLT